jgi:hypothetical protein
MKWLASLVAMFGVLFLAVLATASPAGAAAGRQSPDPTLVPGEVAESSAVFAFDVGDGVAGDGTGADGWRAHTFVVSAGVNPAELDFTVSGLPAGWVGADFDSAGDGKVAAPLFATSGAAVNVIPAVRPSGQINPSSLVGFTFDPEVWNLTDGDYQIGFACTGPTADVRQWWLTPVTISSSAAPFMTAPSAADDLPAPTATTSKGAAVAGGNGVSSTTTTAARAPAAAKAPARSEPGSGGEGPTQRAARPALTTDAATGISWWHLAALGAAVIVVGGVAYLLIRAARHRPLRAVTAARYPKGTSP